MEESEKVAQRISAFEKIRDIPYRIGLTLQEQDYSCATKPSLLAQKLNTLGFQTRRIICDFSWRILGLPEEILKLAKKDTDTHEYLEVLIPESRQWVKVDPSWDRTLSKAGFRVSYWDGQTSTVVGVDPIKTYSVEESAQIIAEEEQIDPKARENYLAENKVFFSALNSWLEQQRKK